MVYCPYCQEYYEFDFIHCPDCGCYLISDDDASIGGDGFQARAWEDDWDISLGMGGLLDERDEWEG